MKKLLILTPSASVHGGVERIIESLGAGLPAHGFDVLVGLAKGKRFHRPEAFRREYPELRCIEIDGSSGTRTGRLESLGRALRRVKPDIVLCTRLFDAYEAVALRKLEGDPIRFVTAIRAYEADYIADLASFSEFTDLCVTDGKLISDAVERFTSFPAERIVSIPGGVAPALHPVERIAGSPLRIGYVGRLERRQKRIFDLVELLDQLERRNVPWNAVVAGSGPDESELKLALKAKPFGHRVEFRGWMSPSELYREIYPNLEVFVHFAEWEGVTIAPREAMAHGGVPVISEFVGCREEGVFRHGETALTFPIGNIETAALHLERLYRDDELWSRLSRAASESQSGIFSESGAIAEWSNALFRSLALEPRRGGSVPRLMSTATSRLDSWVGPRRAEMIRRFVGRQYPHTEPGGEWPHAGGAADPRLVKEIEAFGGERV